ncbi:MAG: tetratricopeptide repeat protein, partial [Phycisphaerae bacterium]
RSLLDGPISVQDVPLLMPIILGLLLAALISIPILVSMLYRFWSSIPFIGVVAFLAVMPWLAISLLLSCVLASVRPFKTRLRFVSALLGLVPAAIYLIVSWHGTTDFVAGTIDPIDRIKFVAPLVLAIVAAAAVFAVVLAMARLVDYRPGAIAPLLAVMLGLPVALFEFNVGRDELYYRVLEAAAEWYFTDRPAEDDLERAVWDRWERRPGPRRSIAAVRELEETRWLFELMSDIGPYQETAMTSYQKELADWCDWFVKYFPDSRYAVNALFIKARALDTRIDAGEFRRTKWIHFYDDHPSRKSRPTWRMIAETRPDSTAGAVALLRLAQLDAREGLIERATDRLDTVLRRLALLSQPHPPSPDVSTTLTQVLKRDSPQESLAISHERVLLETHRLHDLLAANRDPLYGYEPIHGARQSVSGVSFGCLDLDRRSEGYLHDLENLLATYPNCQIEDNIDLEIAIATEQIERRTQRLERVLERFPDRDAVPEALYRLAVAYKAAGQPDDSAETFARLLHAFPDSIWSRQAGFYTAGRPLIAGSRDAHDSNDQSSGS